MTQPELFTPRAVGNLSIETPVVGRIEQLTDTIKCHDCGRMFPRLTCSEQTTFEGRVVRCEKCGDAAMKRAVNHVRHATKIAELSKFAEDCNANAGIDHAANQSGEILRYLQAGNTLTPLEALEKFGCFRLGARIWDLKRDGYAIESEMVEVAYKRVARYRLV